MVWGWIRGTLGVDPPTEPLIPEARIRAMQDHQQRVLLEMNDAERQYVARLMDDRRFLDLGQ